MIIVDNILLLLFMMLFAVSCWGLGSLVLKDELHSLRILLGMMLVLFVIGVLNLVGVAYLSLMSLPLAYGLFEAYQQRSGIVKDSYKVGLLTRGNLIVVGALFVIWLLCAVTVAFPDAYNFHDDYQKYFIQPMKLLETGSFYGSTLSTIGKETLGAQAAYQSLFVGFLGIEAINTFDAVFCLLLSAFLLLEFSHKKNQLPIGLAGAALLVCVHPQYVNITSIYSFVCFAIGTVILHERILSTDSVEPSALMAGCLGALYASIMTLKTPYAFFVIAHFPLVVLSMLGRSRSVSLHKWSFLATVFGLLVISPWAVRTVYLSVIAPGADGMSLPLMPDVNQLMQLLSTNPTFYGGTPLYYTLLLVAGFVLVALHRFFGLDNSRTSFWASTAALISASLVLIYAVAFIGDEQYQFIHTLRYSVPVLIGLVPVALMLLGIDFFKNAEQASGTNKAIQAFGLLTPICLILLWLPVKIDVIKQASECGSTLSFRNFACSEAYMTYNDSVLDGTIVDQVEKLQLVVPEGAPIVAWLNYSHLLDFQRNPIIEVDTAGLRNPWAVMPNVQYLMLDVQGFATLNKAQLQQARDSSKNYERDIKQAALDFIAFLETQIVVDEVLASEQGIIVYKIRVPIGKNFK